MPLNDLRNRILQSPLGQLWTQAHSDTLPLFDQGLPSYVTCPMGSGWSLVSGASDEVDVLYGAYGTGRLYLKDPQGTVHRIEYTGIGASTGKALVAMPFGSSHSTEDMWSTGGLADVFSMLGQIGLAPGQTSLKISNFDKRFGGILSIGGAGLHGGPPVGPGVRKKILPHSSNDVWELAAMGAGLSLVAWGVPPIAFAWQVGLLRMLPGIGVTTMACYFTIDNDYDPPG